MKKTLLYLSTLILLTGCGKQETLNLPSNNVNNKNLNTLVTLNIGNDTIYTQDFIYQPDQIDSVICTDVQIMLSSDKKNLVIAVNPQTPDLFNVNIWIKGIPYAIPCRKSDKVDYVFTFDPHGKKYGRVQIAGQMNDWTPNLTPDLELNAQGLYEVTLNLNPGNYLYQMLIDGEQNHDPNNPNKVDNGYGKYNSILQVKGNTDKYPALATGEIEKNKFTLLTQGNPTKVIAYWQNYLLPAELVTNKNGEITVVIPAEADSLDRSFIRVWASNEFGVSNDILVPLQKGKVLTKSSEITRHDQQAQIIYFMLIDRFLNGDSTNDHPINSPDVRHRVDFYGGDLAGIQKAIDNNYFKDLGVNTLWISPVNQNPDSAYGYYAPAKTKFTGYHGYWPISFSKVDYRFGTNQELKDLVSDAHKKDMNILLDYVAHHVHEKNPLYKEHPEYFTSLYLPNGELNTERWNDYRLTTWFDTFLPTFNMFNPKVVDMMSDSAMYWVNEFNIDGFRHDACKHVRNDFWRALTYKIKEKNNGKSLYQIGETYGSPELISSYLNTGMLNGQFDFNVFEDANVTFAGVAVPDLQRVNGTLQGSFRTYGNHNLMGYISGNHDKPRFMALASGDLKFGEDSKLAGWERHIGITDSTAYNKMALMQTFILTIPGIPVIYYGDEIGMTGANDPDCRRMMRFTNWNNRETKLQKTVSKLAHLRKENPVLIYGDFINLKVEKESWVYARKYFDKEAIIIFNNSDKPKDFEVEIPAYLQKSLKATFGNKFSLKGGKLKISLPAYSSEILI